MATYVILQTARSEASFEAKNSAKLVQNFFFTDPHAYRDATNELMADKSADLQ